MKSTCLFSLFLNWINNILTTAIFKMFQPKEGELAVNSRCYDIFEDNMIK